MKASSNLPALPGNFLGFALGICVALSPSMASDEIVVDDPNPPSNRETSYSGRCGKSDFSLVIAQSELHVQPKNFRANGQTFDSKDITKFFEINKDLGDIQNVSFVSCRSEKGMDVAIYRISMLKPRGEWKDTTFVKLGLSEKGDVNIKAN